MDTLKKSKVSPRNKNKQKAKLLDIIRKKKECEKNALSIVLELIDGGLEEDVLLNKLCSINVCHYEDVVEERFILKQCGYVNCNQQLTFVPTQKYKISLVEKKVYDITERKKFCSNMCYKRSEYLKSQLLTSPLWLRDTETIPNFKLLKCDRESSKININSGDNKSLSSKQNDTEEKCNIIRSNEQLVEKISELKI